MVDGVELEEEGCGDSLNEYLHGGLTNHSVE